MKTPLRGAALIAPASILLFVTASRANAPAGRYQVSTDTVYDMKTGLTWQRAATTATYPWGSATTAGTAQSYCASLSLTGTGWRLPTVKELTSIVDPSQATAPLVDATAFSGTASAGFWSSTPVIGVSTSAWFVHFGTGAMGDRDHDSGSKHARCVR